MNVNAITSTNTGVPSQSAKAAVSSTAGGEERDMFMSLLVAQLKNQDPLSPQDGTAFVAQLAQFNSLDQLVGIRQSIDDLNALMKEIHPPTTATPSPVN